MTLQEKVGQMLQADISAASPDDVRTYGLGSVLAGGNSAPKRNLRAPPADWIDLTRSYAQAASTSHSAIPLLFGIDAVHGNGHVRGATIFPHNIGLALRTILRLLSESARPRPQKLPLWARTGHSRRRLQSRAMCAGGALTRVTRRTQRWSRPMRRPWW